MQTETILITSVFGVGVKFCIYCMIFQEFSTDASMTLKIILLTKTALQPTIL